MPSIISPYANKSTTQWLPITKKLVANHPLGTAFLRDSVLKAWSDIFSSRIGLLRIGPDIQLQPQTMGFILHELIPAEVATFRPGWARGRPGIEKDLHFAANPTYSIELKTSSNPRKVFGNRSYAQPATSRSRGKDGFFLTANFEKFVMPYVSPPGIVKISFGYLEHSDWRAQKSATGQQAHLTPEAYAYKLLQIYP